MTDKEQTEVYTRIAEALVRIAAALEKQNEILLSITHSKSGEELRNEFGELNVRYLRGTK